MTIEEIRKAIEDGATSANWISKPGSDHTVIASYRIRVHSVVVEIPYSEGSYEIRYKSSVGMKLYCTEEDKYAGTNRILSGHQVCPGGADPLYIHDNYADWVSDLKKSIDNALAFSR